ncbi:MAG: hypothetical protein U0270_04750 [Labilithrix sp.]
MIVSISVLAIVAVVLLFVSGYLFGARRGVAARRQLADHAEVARREVEGLSARVEEMQNSARDASAVKADLERAISGLEHREMQAVRAQIHELTTALAERESQQVALRAKDTKNLHEFVQKALSPIIDRDRVGRELAQLDGGTSLGELPRLLDAIAEKGGFSSVVLSDDVGLPLAASAAASSVDWLAGVASIVLTLVDRAERVGQPKPIGVLIRDDANQLLLHRAFDAGGNHFLLTAVTRAQDVSPNALDPALAKLERALARRETQV